MAIDVTANRSRREWTIRQKAYRVLWSTVVPLFRFSPRVFWCWRRFILRLFGAKIGRGCHIYPSVRIAFPAHLDLGRDSAIGDRVILYSLGYIQIGARSTVSQGSHLCAGTHDHTLPERPLIKAPIYVGEDSWIAADAFIGPNVCIGNGVIVGARAVVVRDIADGVTVVGNPARVVKETSQ